MNGSMEPPTQELVGTCSRSLTTRPHEAEGGAHAAGR